MIRCAFSRGAMLAARIPVRLFKRLDHDTRYAASRLRNRLWGYPPVRVVTAADSRYIFPLNRLLNTMERYEPSTQVTVFDLGLNPSQRRSLGERSRHLEVKTFPFEQHPDWMHVSNSAGFWAWKPLIIEEMAASHDGFLIWMDSSVIVREPLLLMRLELSRHGLYSPKWPGVSTRSYSHPDTVVLLNGNDVADEEMLIAAVVGLDCRCRRSMNLIREWAAYARRKECIAPEGATPSRHKGDQSILSILASKSGILEHGRRDLLGFFIDNIRANWRVDDM